MKRIKEFISGLFVVCVAVFIIVFVYQSAADKSHRELAKRISELSSRGGPPETIEGLKQAIALYENQIELNVKEGVQTGTYWKILGIRLADKGMHKDALDAFDRAIYYNAEDPVLYQLTGVSAGVTAKSVIGFSANAEREREHYFKLCENAYLRALELDPLYAKPMYGLAILYVFELDKPEKAIPYLERYMQIQTNDIPAMFVLARAYYMAENFSGAVMLYDRIIDKSRDQKVKAEARNNKETILGLMYE
jgi:tetratricopeptide (TPR) repeat protein